MEKGEKKEVITLKSVTDDVVGGTIIGLGVISGSVAMQYASAVKNKEGQVVLNPWLVSGIGIALGIGGRIASNYVKDKKIKDGIKDFSSGIMAAGMLDLTIKGVKKFAPDFIASLPAPVQASIPQSLGGDREQVFSIPQLYGPGSSLLNGDGDYQPANVVSSALLQ